MAFIVKKKISGNEYYYLNETKRVDGKVVSKCLGYLGKDRKEAEKKMKKILRKREDEIKSGKEEKKSRRKLVHKSLSVEELANFCKRKGFVFRSSDIYGGFAGFWDFGVLGVEMFNNLKRAWWNFFVQQREDVVGIEASIVSHPRTWKASGHLESFNDIAVVCKKCKKATKIDVSEEGMVRCECGGEYESQGKFNLMFKTKVGALDAEEAYLRGETAQGMFMDFKLVSQTSRMQPPFGIAQIGRCFRNEIAPRDFLFRSREFHIGEIEFFINPEEKKCGLLEEEHLNVRFNFLSEEEQKNNSNNLEVVRARDLIENRKLEEWHAYWLAQQIIWFRSLGLEEIKIREHTRDELSHYSSATFDIDYEYAFGSKEVAGNANRGQFDLTAHEKESKQSMEFFDEKSGKKFIPKVIEPTFGIERIFLALLSKAYNEDEKGNAVLRLPSEIAPVKAAVFPIIKKPEFEKIAQEVADDLKKEWNVVYDRSGSIGRRYARNDEIGTPYCITIDADSVKKKDVTIRERDTTGQIRVKVSDLRGIMRKLISGDVDFPDAGRTVK